MFYHVTYQKTEISTVTVNAESEEEARQKAQSCIDGKLLRSYFNILESQEYREDSFSDLMKKYNASDFTIKEITDDAVSRGLEAANATWKLVVMGILEEFCREQEQFTVDDFRGRIKASGVTTHDNRAMGGLMRKAQASGLIEPTGTYKKSKTGHGSKLQYWKSLIYGDCGCGNHETLNGFCSDCI